MWREPSSGGGLEWIMGWMFALLILAFAAEALVATLKPLLPWLALAGLIMLSVSWWLHQRERW